MEIVNLSPHDIVFVLPDNRKVVIPASHMVARVASSSIPLDPINDIPVNRVQYSEVENLPERKANVIYLVSSLVASRVPDREDVFVPSDFVRDEQNRIVAAKSISHV